MFTMKCKINRERIQVLPMLVCFCFVLIPIVDSLYGMQEYYNVFKKVSIGQVYRFLILAVMLLITFYKNNKEKMINVLLIVAYFVVSAFFVAFEQGNFKSFFSEMIVSAKAFLPIFIVEALLNLDRHKIINSKLVEKIIDFLSIMVPITLIVPKILGVGFVTYASSNTGFKGFYVANNGISIVCILLFVFAIFNIFDKVTLFNSIKLILISITMFPIGAKALYGLGIMAFGLAVLTELQKKTTKSILKVGILVLLIFVVCLLAIQYFNEIFEQILSRQKFLANSYNNWLVYLTSDRNTRIPVMWNNLKEAEHIVFVFLFGTGMTEGGSTYVANIVEMDFFDSFFKYGFLGAVILTSYWTKIFRKWKEVLPVYKVAIVCGLIYSFLGGHVLVNGAIGGSIFAAVYAGGMMKNETNYS